MYSRPIIIDLHSDCALPRIGDVLVGWDEFESDGSVERRENLNDFVRRTTGNRDPVHLKNTNKTLQMKSQLGWEGGQGGYGWGPGGGGQG